MKKIALLLGVSKYNNANDLPACRSDVLLVKDLLDSSGEYEEILCIHKYMPSSKIKQDIVSFLKRFENETISQFFYYYTGHGDFDGNEFYHLLGDFDKSKHKQTTIENSELDKWIRLLKPELTIKIVDACHAGIQYIKDPDAFQKYLSITPKSFNSCYFMYSSQKEEYSYQDNQLSFFTKSFAESVSNFSGTEIRFKDIIDYISDDFESVSNQTPFFVTQATNTEIFTRVDEKLRNHLSQRLQQYLSISSRHIPQKMLGDKEASLIDLVKEEAEKYCTEEEVKDRLQEIEKYLTDLKLEGEIEGLYQFSIEPISSLQSELPQLIHIGKWLSENEDEYFAEPTTKTEEYEEEVNVPKKRQGGLLFHILADREYETKIVKKQKKVINGYRTTYEFDNPAYRITAKPRFENLEWYDIHIAYVFSKTEIRFFYLLSTLKALNWQERRRQPTEKWRMQVCGLKDKNQIIETLQDILINYFTLEILKPIREKYLPESDELKDTGNNEESQQGT